MLRRVAPIVSVGVAALLVGWQGPLGDHLGAVAGTDPVADPTPITTVVELPEDPGAGVHATERVRGPAGQDVDRLTAALEQEHLAAKLQAAARAEAARVEVERVEAERVEAERVEAERAAAEQADAERVAAEQDRVRSFQQPLHDLGWYVGKVDGQDGPATREAVRSFQLAARLTVDGVVGPQTRAALAAPDAPSRAQWEAATHRSEQPARPPDGPRPQTAADRCDAAVAKLPSKLTRFIAAHGVAIRCGAGTSGTLGTYDIGANRIEINPRADVSDAALYHTLLHETGHAVDFNLPDTAHRTRWSELRGWGSRGWMDFGGARDDRHGPAGDFAEAFVQAYAGTSSRVHHGPYTAAQIEFIRSLP